MDPTPSEAARELWFVRHGATEWNRKKTLQGWADIGLSPEGEAQMWRLAERLRGNGQGFTALFSSDLLRARQSAEILARRLGLPVLDTPYLREQDMGFLTGKTKAEGRRAFPEAFAAFDADPWHTPLPGGESLADVAARYGRFLEGLPPGRFLVVTHSRLIKAALILALEAPKHLWPRLRVPNGSLTVIRYPEACVLRLGDVAHLEDWCREPAPLFPSAGP